MNYISSYFLKVKSNATMANWIVRLEDVNLDGEVSLITIGAINGAHRKSPPTYLEPDSLTLLIFSLRFTTWTFSTGHRIRIAISNGMFPAYWPTPFPMKTSLILDPNYTYIELPVVPQLTSMRAPPPKFTEKQIQHEDILPGLFSSGRVQPYTMQQNKTSTTVLFGRSAYELLPNACFISSTVEWNFTCSRTNPADVKWTARAEHTFVFDVQGYATVSDVPLVEDGLTSYPNVNLSQRRYFRLRTESTVYSDEDYFYLQFQREIFASNHTNLKLPASFQFKNRYKRQYQ